MSNSLCHAIYNEHCSYILGINNHTKNTNLDSSESKLDYDDEQYDTLYEDPQIYHPSSPLSSEFQDSTPTQTLLDDPMDDEHGRVLTLDEHQQFKDDIWVNLIISMYPGQNVAKIYSNESYSVYLDYKHNLSSDASTSNLYAPFSSKLDWEFARWAKLHGVGSTSASELMSIAGVSLSCYLSH
jgi:hypothetical protein